MSTSYCEAGTSQIQSIVVDTGANPGVIYAATNRGDILVFESFAKGEVTECRIKGRLYTKLFG